MPATVNRDEVYEALRTVYDPEIPVKRGGLGADIRRSGE